MTYPIAQSSCGHLEASWNGGTLRSSIYRWIFPSKPSSSWGTPWRAGNPGKIPAMSRRDLPFVSGESLPEEKPIQKKPTASGNRSSRSPVMVTEELVCPGSMEDIVLMDVKYVHEVYEPTFQGNHLLASLYSSRWCPTEVTSSTDTSSSRRISSLLKMPGGV